MSSHSQFKRFNILQQLEQAIKKKTHQKYKSKSKSKPIELKPSRTPILEKQSVGVTVTRKSNQGINQPPPPTVKSKQIDFKVKKYQNKKFDKIVSLINYTITSADKALKYVSLSSNFEAEFAYKLYLSDRQNLMNELNNLNLQQIMANINPMSNMIQPAQMKALQSNQNSNIEIHSLKNQNDKLKKQIMIMQGEIKKYKHREHEQKSNVSSPLMGKGEMQKEDLLKRQIDVKQIQVNKLSDLLKRLCNFNEVYDYLDLVDKEMKYRSALASAGLSGFELNKIQRDEFERNLVSLDGRIGDLQGLMITKMEKMAEGQDEEVFQELEAINKLLHKKIAPILKENQTQSLENKKISEIISMYVNYTVKRQRELQGSLEKMEGKLIDYIQMAKDFQKKDLSIEQKFEQLYKENQLVKTNLKDIYEELKALLTDSLRKSGISDSSDITFETLLKQIEITLMKNHELKGIEKKFKELSEEDSRKNALVMKQNSIIENMEYELNEMKNHLKDSQDRKKQVEQYVLLLQKKKKQDSKDYQDMRVKFDNFAKQLEESQTLLYEKETIIKRLEEQMEYTKVDIHKLSSLIRSKEQQIQERQDLIHQRQTKIQKLLAENSIHREQAIEIKARLDQQVHDKNRILEHMRFLEDRLKQAESHYEALSEESSEKIKELNLELSHIANSLKETHKQREHFEIMYNNLLQTRESQDERRMDNFKQVQQELSQIRHQNHEYKKQTATLSNQLNSISAKAQTQQDALVQSHELEKQQLMNEINQMKTQIQQLRADSQKTHQFNHMQLMQQNISSQEDIMEDINHKEEQIIQLKRTIQELEAQIQQQAQSLQKLKNIQSLHTDSNSKQNIILQLQHQLQNYIAKNQQLQTNLQSALTQFHQTNAKNTLLQQKLLELQGQLVDKSPQNSHNDSLAYEQQLRIEQMEQTLNQIHAQFQAKQQQAETLKNQLSSKQSQFIQLQQKMTQIETMLEEKQSQLENRQNLLQTKFIQAQLENKLAYVQTKQAQLQNKEIQLQQKFTQLQQRLNELQERQNLGEIKQQQLQAKYNQLQTKILQHQEKQNQLQVISSENSLRTHQLSVRQSQLTQRQSQLQQRQFNLQQKEQLIEEKEHQLDSRITELHQRQTQLIEKQTQLQQRENQLQQRHSRIQKLNQQNELSQSHQQPDHQQQDFEERSKQLQALVQRYNQQLQQRDKQLLQYHQQFQQKQQQLQQKQQQITHLNQQILNLSDTLSTERIATQSLSSHISTYQQTIQQLQNKLQTLQVTHEEKDLQIQSLNQKVQELYVEIVDLKKQSDQKIQFKEQKSDDFIMSIQSSIKADKLNDSPIENLQGISPQKVQSTRKRSEQENVDNQDEPEQPRQYEEEQSPVQCLEARPQELAQEQEEQTGQRQAQQSDLLKEGSNSQSQKKSDNWLSAEQGQKRIESQVRQVTKRQSQQIEQYQASTIEIIQSKYKRLINELKLQVDEKQQNISQVRQSHELLENQNNQLIVHIQMIERAKIELENELIGLREIARQRMEENDRLNDQIIRIQQQGQENTKKLVKEIQQYQELHVLPLKHKMQQKNREIDQLHLNYQQLETTLQQTKRTKQQYIQALEHQSLQKQQQFNSKLQSLRAEVDKQRLKYQQQSDLLSSQKQLLVTQLKTLQQQSIKSNSKAITSIQTQINILKEQNQLVHTKYSTFELRAELKMRQLRSELIRLTTQVRMKQDEIASLRKDLEEKQSLQQNFKSQHSSIIIKNSEQIEHFKQQLDETNDKLIRNNIMLQQAQRKISLLQQQLNLANSVSNQKNNQLNELQSVIEELKYTNHSLTQSVTQLNSQLEKRQHQIQHLQISQQIQTSPQRYYPQQEYTSKPYQTQGNNLEEFEDMRSQKMNESMMSNQPEKQQLSRRVNGDIQVHEAQFENFLAKNLPIPSYHNEGETHEDLPLATHTQDQQTQTQQSRIAAYDTIKTANSNTDYQLTHQQQEQPTNQKQDEFFDEFDDMKSEKMNASMVSNDATEQRGQYYREQANLIQNLYLTEDIQETPHSEQVQSLSKQQSNSGQVEQETPKTQQRFKENQHTSPQKQPDGQNFDQFNDMKSQQMNQSMMSNEPQPTETKQDQFNQDEEVCSPQKSVQTHQNFKSGQNIVDPHEDREHSEGSYEDQTAIKKQVVTYLGHQYELASPQKEHNQYVEVEHHQNYSQKAQHQTDNHPENRQQEKLKEDQQQQQQGQQLEGQDLDQFNDLQSQKMNQSMMSNEPQPTEHREPFLGLDHVIHHQNLVTPNEVREHYQGEVDHHNQEQQVQEDQAQSKIHFKSQQQIPIQSNQQDIQAKEDEQDFDEFNDMKSEQMNASMMSNDPSSIEQSYNIQESHNQPDTQEVKRQQAEMEEPKQKADLDEFNDMGSQRMNESMMSNQPEATETEPLSSPIQIQQRHNIVDPNENLEHSEDSLVNKYDIKHNTQDLDIEPDLSQLPQTHSQQTPHKNEFDSPQKSQAQQQNFDQFNDMRSEKMNESMMSNEPEPSQHPDYLYQKIEKPHQNIVKANEDVQHSQGQQMDQLQFEVQQEQKEHPKSVQQIPIAHIEIQNQRHQIPQYDRHSDVDQDKKPEDDQQDIQNLDEPDFDEFNDMKSEQMNASMISNDPQPTDNRHQYQLQSHNIVDAHQDKEYSECQKHQHREQQEQGEEQQTPKGHHMSQQNYHPITHQQQPQPTQLSPKNQNPDFDEFNDMKSQKMNQSMMSNEPQPTQNQKYDQIQQNQLSDQLSYKNLVSTQINRAPRSQYNYHHSAEVSQVVIHKALAVAQIPQDQDINNFNQIAEDRMNESMMSNEPEVSDKINLDQPSDNQSDEQPNVQHKIFEHNLVTVSRTSDLNKKQQGDINFHDGRSQGGNLQANKDQFQEQELDTVQVDPKKKSIIQTHHNHYRSQYEFGNSPFGQSRDEQGLEMLRVAGRTHQFNGSVASNQVEVNDIGGNFINEYALNEGRNNKVERNIIMSHNHLYDRSQRNLQNDHLQEAEELSQNTEQYHKVNHSSSRSEYAYNHLTETHINKATSERRQQSGSMVEDRNQQDNEKDDEVMETPLQAVQQCQYLEKQPKQTEGEIKSQQCERQGQAEQVKTQQPTEKQGQQSKPQEERGQSESSEQSEADQQQYQQQNGPNHHHLCQDLIQTPQGIQPQNQQTVVPQQEQQDTYAAENKNYQQDYSEQKDQYNHQQIQDYQPEGLSSSRLQREANQLNDSQDPQNQQQLSDQDRQEGINAQQSDRDRNSLPLYTQENFDITQSLKIKYSNQQISQEQPQINQRPQQDNQFQEKQPEIDFNQIQTEQIQTEQNQELIQQGSQLQDQNQASQIAAHQYYEDVTTRVGKTASSYCQKNHQLDEDTLLQDKNNCLNINHDLSPSLNVRQNTQNLDEALQSQGKQVEESKEVLETEKEDQINLIYQQQELEQYLQDQHQQQPEQPGKLQMQVVENYISQITHSLIGNVQQNEQNLPISTQDQYQEQPEYSGKLQSKVVDKYMSQIAHTITTGHMQQQQQTITPQNHSPNSNTGYKRQQQSNEEQQQSYQLLEEQPLQQNLFNVQPHQQCIQQQEQTQQQHEQENQQEQGNDFDAFNDMASERMNASMMSNNEELNPTTQLQTEKEEPAPQLETQKVENSQENINQKESESHQENQQEQGNDFDAFNDMASERMNASMMSNNEEINFIDQNQQQTRQHQQSPKQQANSQEKQEQPSNLQQPNKDTEQEQQDDELDAFNDMQSEKMDASMMSNNNNESQLLQPLYQSHAQHKQPLQEQQAAQQIEENNFSNFNEMPSQNLGGSLISNNEQQHQPTTQNQPLAQLISASPSKQQIEDQTLIPRVQQTVTTQSPDNHVNLDELEENKSQNQEEQGNFSNFMEMPNEQMSSSMISNHQEDPHSLQAQQITPKVTLTTTQVFEAGKNENSNQPQPTEDQFDQNNFSDFNDMTSQKMGQSIMSNQQEPEQTVNHQKYQPFAATLQSPEQTIPKPSQQVQYNDQNNFSDFNDMASQKIGDSIISNNDSMGLQHQIAQQREKHVSPIKNKSPEKHQIQEANDFDAFNSMVQQKMDGSMVSNNQDKQIDWFDNQNKNTHPNQQIQEQGFSDFKDYNSEHMSQSQTSAQEQIQPANFDPQPNPLRLNNLAQKDQNLGDLLGMEKVLPSDILLTSERKVLAQYEFNHDDEQEDFNALINFLPQSEQKKQKTQGQDQAAQEEGMDTNRSNSFNEDLFEFQVRKSVQSIGSRADIFENFQNPLGSKISSDGSEFKSNEMIKSAKRIENAKGKGNDLFGFDDIMEQEQESSQHSSTYQRQNDDDFGDFLNRGNEPAPSPVNKKSEENDFFNFDKMADGNGGKIQKKKSNPFEDYE